MRRHVLSAMMRPERLALLSLVLLLCSAACAGRQQPETADTIAYSPPGQTDCRVKRFIIDGVSLVDEETLRQGLSTKKDPGWRARRWTRNIPVLGAEPHYYNRVQFERDRQRILTFYQSRGHFNASIASQNIERCRDGKSITIRLRINEGAPTLINTLNIVGLEATGPLRETITARSPIAEGQVFTQEGYMRAREAIERALREESYAYARVRGRAVIDPSKAKSPVASVTFFVDPGPKATFGETLVEGLDKVDEDYVRDAISFRPDTIYTSRSLQETQERIYDLGVFSLVTVQPTFQSAGESTAAMVNQLIDASVTPTDEIGPLGITSVLDRAQLDAETRSKLTPRVPITIRLKEAKQWTGRIGAGFSINSTRQDVHGGFNFVGRNVGGYLGKLEQFNTVGYALTPGILRVQVADPEEGLFLDDFGNRGVFFDVLLRYSQPQFFERLTTGFVLGNVKRDIQETHIGLVPSASIGLRRPLFANLLQRKLQFEVSYNLFYIYYQSFNEDFGRALRLQGLDPNTENPSLLLEYLEQKLIYDARDSPINPTRGIRAQASLQEASRYILGGEYAYIKPQFEIDGYIPIGEGAVTALRASIGTIYNINVDEGAQTKGVPIQSRLYGGGRGSLRSFSPRYFGYFTDDLIDPGPIGSTTLLELGVEQRVRVKRNLLDVGDLWGAVFLDAGSFSDRQLSLDTAANTAGTMSTGELFQTLIYGFGLGLYWLTPIGPLRGDLAFTLTDISQDPRYLPNPNVVDDPNTPVNEAVLEQRYRQATLNKLRRADFYLGIGHSF